MQDEALGLLDYGNMCVVRYAGGGQAGKMVRAGTAWEQQG